MSRKKEDALSLWVKGLRKKAREETRERVLAEYEDARRKGELPWEGMWLRADDIRKIQERMKSRDRVSFTEVAILFAFMIFFSYAFYRALMYLLPA